MIDHLSVRVTDVSRAVPLYTAALAALGFEKVMAFPEMDMVAFGPKGKPILWLTRSETVVPTHLAFQAEDRAAVARFHEVALGAGARDNGPPGVRPEYHPGYYGAFVLDHDGNNLEAVAHEKMK